MSVALTFCPTCCEVCQGHPTLCTICGDNLTEAPSSSPALIPTAVSNINSIDILRGVNINDRNIHEEWESPPAAAMDPQHGQPRTFPTATECLDRIPRIKIDQHSAILHEATVEIQHSLDDKKQKEVLQFDAAVGEFLPHPPFKLSGTIALCSPNIQGKLPISQTSNGSDTILFMERGDLTFVQKSQNAKSVGAIAVLCANHIGIWPYVMRDSEKRSKPDDIPIVMVKRSDGKVLHELMCSLNYDVKVTCRIEAKKAQNTCIICTEGFSIGSTVLRLPLCGHAFHEKCALSWLTKNNTCPYCRRELPAEDKDHEQNRRRLGRSHAARDEHDESLHENQWEMIFG